MADEMHYKSIVVDLDQVHGARVFDKENSFFQRELAQALEIVMRLGERAAAAKRSAKYGRLDDKEEVILHGHDCVSVIGRRGVGKTSFILSLGKLVADESKKDTQEKCKIAVLSPIDPTMMEDTDTFLSLVLANVLQHVDKHLDGKEWPTELDQSLAELSSKIGVLAPASVHEALWKDILLDPENFTFEIMKKARSGIGLGRSVNQFLLSCAKVCDVDAFMQAIDDVDTAVHRGWPVLETLRKYLSSPYLITVLSGDAQLFKAIVWQHKRKSLTAKLNIEEDDNIPSNVGKAKRSMIDHLVDQYLMKVMPPHQRVILPIVAEEIVEASLREQEFVAIKHRKQDGGKIDAYDNFSQVFLMLTKEILHFPNALNFEKFSSLDCFKPGVAGFLSRLIPRYTRSLIQFMEMLKVNKSSLQQKAMERDGLFEQLMHVFEITLSRRNISYRDMQRLWHGEHIEWFTSYCMDTREEAPKLWSLDRDYDDVGWCQRLILLQAVLLQGWKRCKFNCDLEGKTTFCLLNAFGPMSYMIKTCLPCWIADEKQLDADQVSTLKSLMLIGISNDHVEIASLSLAYLLREEERSAHGILYLLPPTHWIRRVAESHLTDLSSAGFHERPKTGSMMFDAYGFLPWWRFLKNCNVQRSWKIYLPDLIAFQGFAGASANFFIRFFGFVRYDSLRRSTHYYCAPFIGFARIVDLVFADGRDEDFANFLQELIRIKPYAVPLDEKVVNNGSVVQNTEQNDSGEGFSEGDEDIDLSQQWRDNLLMWRKSLKTMKPEDVPPPRVISRVFIRVIEQLKVMNSTSNFAVTTWSVGQFLEQWVCCLINAVIIEELSHQIYLLKNYEGVKFNYDMVAKGRGAVSKNLQILIEHPELGAFSRKWLSCPILIALVRADLRDQILKACGVEFEKNLFVTNLMLPQSETREADIYVVLCSLMYQTVRKDYGVEDSQKIYREAAFFGYPVGEMDVSGDP